MILNFPFFLCIHTDIHIYYTTSFHFKSLHGVLLHTFLLEWEKGTGSIPVFDRWCNECLHCSSIIPFCRDLPWNVPHPHFLCWPCLLISSVLCLNLKWVDGVWGGWRSVIACFVMFCEISSVILLHTSSPENSSSIVSNSLSTIVIKRKSICF